MQFRLKTAAVALTAASALVIPASAAAAAPAGGTNPGHGAGRHLIANSGSSDAQTAASGLTYTWDQQGNYFVLYLWWDDVFAGETAWSQDPSSYDFDADGKADPGDAIIAFDTTADGLGVEARLSTGRVASTRGHDSPYSSGWKTGNLPEDNFYKTRACLVKGSWEACTAWWSVTS
jgi:hypothetical protein